MQMKDISHQTHGHDGNEHTMNDHLSVETPEQININFKKAGIGSRFYAALLDTLLLGLLLFIGIYVNFTFISELGDIVGNWLAAIGGVLIFAMYWGYYMVFEITTNGQSPGKMALGIRVIKEGGYPINFSDSAIRNLVRIVDFLPFFYGTGLLVMLINGNWQRLGDLAAGTIIVKTSRKGLNKAGESLTPDTSHVDQSTEERLYSDWIQPMLVTDNELQMIREYLHRRPILSPIRRLELARTIGSSIADKMGGVGAINYDKFLVEVYELTSDRIKIVDISSEQQQE